MLDTTTGELVKTSLKREFYCTLPRPVRVGIEATGSTQWFVNLLEELGMECLVGHPAEIRSGRATEAKT
jgi:transposase